MAIPMLKIRRPNGCLIFNMEIAILRLDGLYIETGLWIVYKSRMECEEHLKPTLTAVEGVPDVVKAHNYDDGSLAHC